MKKHAAKIGFMIGGVALALAVLVAASVWVLTAPPRMARDRPLSVPENAIRTNGVTRHWVHCASVPGWPASILHCDVYADLSGVQLRSGNYQWDGKPDDETTPTVLEWDGKTVVIKEGRLVPVGKHIVYANGQPRETLEYPRALPGAMVSTPLQ